MAENKKSVLLYCDIIHTVKELSDEEAGKLFKHYLEYINDLNPVAPDKLTQIVFEPIKQNLKRDLKKWEIKSKRNSEIAIAGWEKRKDANAYERIKSDAKHADKDTVKVIVTDKVKDIIINDKSILDIFFEDLKNGRDVESISMQLNVPLDIVKIRILDFRKFCELQYPTYQKFVSHFKNWLRKNNQTPTEGIKLKKSFKQ